MRTQTQNRSKKVLGEVEDTYIYTYKYLNIFSVNKVADYKISVLNYTKSLLSTKTFYTLIANKGKSYIRNF